MEISTGHFETKLRARPELVSYLLLATAGALVVHISTSHSKYFPKNILLLRLLVENISFVKSESESESESCDLIFRESTRW